MLLRLVLTLLLCLLSGAAQAARHDAPAKSAEAARPAEPVLPPPQAVPAQPIPATQYFPVLPFESPPDALPQAVPVAASIALDQRHPGVKRAIVVIHDAGRDADTALGTLVTLGGAANASTAILAPQFLLPSDLAGVASRLPDKGRGFASWAMPADGLAPWARGDDSVPTAGHQPVSSFTVIDLLLMYLADRNRFPDLQAITVAGAGAGAAFVQRYAALGLGAAALSGSGQNGPALRFVLADPTSYLYLTANRPRLVKTDKKAHGDAAGFALPDAAACPAYDSYPYGLQNLNNYARRRGVMTAKTDYPARTVLTLTAKAADPLPDASCAAQAQGADGAARAAYYRDDLQALYGDNAGQGQFFTQTAGDNSPAALYGSPCGMIFLFGTEGGSQSCAPVSGGPKY